MNKSWLLALPILAVLTVSATLMAAASAAQGLPSALSSNGSAGYSKDVSITAPLYDFTNGNKVECTTSTTGESAQETEHTGNFHGKLIGCVGEVSGIKAKCTGLGDVTGEILALGKYDLVYDTGGTELGVAVAFLIEPVHFTCAGLFLDVVEGDEVCLILEPYVEKTLHRLMCTGERGKQSETFLNDSAETVTPALAVTEGEGTKIGVDERVEVLLLWLDSSGENVQVVFHMT